MATDRHRKAQALFRAGLLAFGAVSSASALAADGWRFIPSIAVRETATDNVDLAADDRRRSDLASEIMPGIRIDGNGARVKLHLDYRMDGLVYARDSSRNNVQNALNATGAVEAIENFLFIDGRASIAQEAVSAFGPRPTDATSVTANRSESRAFQLSPYIRGRLASLADYEVRYRVTDLRSSANAADDSRVGESSAHLSGTTGVLNLDWRAEATSQTVDNALRRDTRADRARGILTYTIDPQFRVSTTAGRERNDYITLDTIGKTTYGAGFEWAPTARTNVHGNWERRFFGTGWNYGARHRTPYLAFEISDKRDVNTDAQRAASFGYGSAYDLLFAALTTRIPDPIQRASETQLLLQQGGIPADLGLPPDFLVGSAFVERRQQASAAFLGVRNTLTFIVYRSNRDVLGAAAASTAPSDLATDIRERGASATFSHRLSGFSSMTAITSWRRTTGESTVNLSSKQWDARLLYVTQLGRRTSGSLELRHVRFDSDAAGASDYRENALIASLLVQF